MGAVPNLAQAAADCGDDPAVQAMERAVKADARNATNNYNLAVAYYQKQCYDPAIDAFERTIKLLKGDNQSQQDMKADCYSILGALYFQVRGDADVSIKDFKLALQIKPDDKDSLNGLSLALIKAGKTDEAEQFLRQTIAADPANVPARYRLAVLLNDRLEGAKKSQAALLRPKVQAAFEQTVKAGDPDPGESPKDEYKDFLALSYTRLGELYRDQDLDRKAEAALTRAVKLAPEDINCRIILGQVYFKLKDYAAMIAQYQKAVELDPKQTVARFNLGVAYSSQELHFEAWQQFKAVTDLEPSNSEALAMVSQELDGAIGQKLALGTAKYTAEEFADAKQAFDDVLTMDPKNKQAAQYLAMVNTQVDKGYATYMKQARAALKAKKQEDAAEAVEKALSLRPDDADALALKEQTHANISKLVKRYLGDGDAAYRTKDYDGAVKAWTRALDFREGKAKAEADLAKLHAMTDSQVSGQLRQAKAALKAKDYAKARAAFRQALAVDRENGEAKNGLTQVNTLIADRVKDRVGKGKKAMAEGDKVGAKALLDSALKLDPDNAEANSMVKKMTGTESNAKLNADNAKALYYKGVDQYVNNKIKEAISTWQEVLAKAPDSEVAGDAAKNIARAQTKLKALANL